MTIFNIYVIFNCCFLPLSMSSSSSSSFSYVCIIFIALKAPSKTINNEITPDYFHYNFSDIISFLWIHRLAYISSLLYQAIERLSPNDLSCKSFSCGKNMCVCECLPILIVFCTQQLAKSIDHCI